MGLDRRRAAALSRLAGTYARHLVRRAVGRAGGDGLSGFRQLYTAERITALTSDERAQLPSHGRCIGCGLCGMAAARAGYVRPERLPSQLTRSLPDLWVTRDLPLDGVDWEAGAAVCPTGVPLPAMRGFIAGRLLADGTDPPPPPTAPPVLPVPPVQLAPHPESRG